MKYYLMILVAAAVSTTAAILCAGPRVKSVTVQLDDGTQQQFAQATTEPAAATAPEPAKCLGVNLEGLRDYGRSFMFIDVMHTCRKYGTLKTPYDAKAHRCVRRAD